MERIHEMLVRLRKAAGLRPCEAARLFQLEYKHLWLYESGNRVPRTPRLYAMVEEYERRIKAKRRRRGK